MKNKNWKQHRRADYYEVDIENAFISWSKSTLQDIKFLGQQESTQAGIIDVLLWDEHWGHPIVVEIKRGKTPSSTIAQLLAYMYFVEWQINYHGPYLDEFPQSKHTGIVHGIIVAEKLDQKTEHTILSSSRLQFVKYTALEDGFRFDVVHKYTDQIAPDKPSGVFEWISKKVSSHYASRVIGYAEMDRLYPGRDCKKVDWESRIHTMEYGACVTMWRRQDGK